MTKGYVATKEKEKTFGGFPTYHHDVIFNGLAADSQFQVSSSSQAERGEWWKGTLVFYMVLEDATSMCAISYYKIELSKFQGHWSVCFSAVHQHNIFFVCLQVARPHNITVLLTYAGGGRRVEGWS